MKGFCILAILSCCAFSAKSIDRVIEGLPTDRPLIIAHRGCSGRLPEHTVEAYKLAVEEGADVIECDLAITKDLKLVCTHDAWLNASTDVHTKPEFNDRVRTYIVSGISRTDYFTIDFTLEELKTLRKIQYRTYRPQSYNGKYPMASFDEYIAVAKDNENNRIIGIYPETKIPNFFNNFLKNNDTTMEDLLVKSLNKHGYNKSTSPCFVQSFSEKSLIYMSSITSLPLIYLVEAIISPNKMEEISKYCYGLGPPKSAIVPVNPLTNALLPATDFLVNAHSYGLKVHPYTFRNEYMFLANDYGSDPYFEYNQFIDLGVDGLFTDFPGSLANYQTLSVPKGGSTKIFSVMLTTLLTSLSTIMFTI